MASSHDGGLLVARYTSLPALLYLLKYRKITFLSPDKWEDRNDAYFMDQYKRRKKLKGILAICFTSSSERYHHWRVFGHGMAGICIEFHRGKLIRTIGSMPGINYGDVEYPLLKVLGRIPANSLPFTKRYPFRDDQEFRMICESDEGVEAAEFPIQLSCIANIKLGPWLPESLVSTVRDTLQAIEGCSKIPVYQTTLMSNEAWR